MLKSPRTFYERWLDSNEPDDPTPAMIFGTLVHQVILEGPDFLKTYKVVPDFGDYRSSTNRLARDRWKAEQLMEDPRAVFVTEKELDDLRGMLDGVLENEDAVALLKNGVTEISGYYVDPETGIACRIRPDFMARDVDTLVDLKTTLDGTEREFSKSIWEYRYDFQMAMYGHGIEVISGRRPKYTAFIALEKTKPYECYVHVADAALLEKGDNDYRRCLRELARCLEKDDWPRAQKRMGNISLPYWAFD